MSCRVRRHPFFPIIAAIALGSIAGNRAPAPDGRWLPFRWLAFESSGKRIERAAILVPVKLDGLPGGHQFQLDLGADQSLLHGAAVREVDARFSLPVYGMTVSGEIAGVAVKNEPVGVLSGFRAMAGPAQPMPVIGTLGLGFFAHRVLVLDYPGRRLMVLGKDEVLPANLEAQATFVAAVARNGKLYVPINIGGIIENGFFFDTGTALPLVTSPEEWRRLTGRRGDELSNERLSGPSWDIILSMVGAPMRQAVAIGPARRQRPVIWFTPDERVSFSVWPATKGLIGNELFKDGFVVVVDLPRGRFGIARSESAQPNKRLHPTAARLTPSGRG